MVPTQPECSLQGYMREYLDPHVEVWLDLAPRKRAIVSQKIESKGYVINEAYICSLGRTKMTIFSALGYQDTKFPRWEMRM